MPKYPNWTPEETFARQVEKSQAFLHRVQAAAQKLSLSSQHRRRLHALLGVGNCTPDPLLSNVPLRIMAARILFDTAKAMLPNLRPAGMPMFHITFVDDIGLTSDRVPALKFAALKRKVDKALRAMSLSGIVMLEVQALTNYPAGGEGRTLLLNAHALCWGAVSRRKLRAAKKTLNESRSWSNTFGALPIKSRRLGHLEDALKIIAYLAKLPHDGKYLVPVVRRSRQRFRFKPTLKGYPNNLALRIAEGLSHYTIFDAVFGVGDGKFIRKAWKHELKEWHREQTSGGWMRVRRFKVAKFWKLIRKRHDNGRYAPYVAE